MFPADAKVHNAVMYYTDLIIQSSACVNLVIRGVFNSVLVKKALSVSAICVVFVAVATRHVCVQNRTYAEP